MLKKLSYRLGFQIPPGVFGKGLQIYYYGSIIVNQNARVSKNSTIYAGVVIGENNGKCPVIIGDNCFIGAGSKVLGAVIIGNNVTIAPNAVVINDAPDNVEGGIPANNIKII